MLQMLNGFIELGIICGCSMYFFCSLRNNASRLNILKGQVKNIISQFSLLTLMYSFKHVCITKALLSSTKEKGKTAQIWTHFGIWQCYIYILYTTLQTYQFLLVFHRCSGVPVRVQKHLGIAVDGNKGLEVSVRRNKVHNRFHLRLRMSPWSTVRLRARTPTRTRTYPRRVHSHQSMSK